MKLSNNTISIAADDEENLKRYKGHEVKGITAKPFTRKMELEITFDLGKKDRKSVESQTDEDKQVFVEETPPKRVAVKRRRPVGFHVPISTRILMKSFEGTWERKCCDDVHHFVMDPLLEYASEEKTRKERCFRKSLHYLLIRDDAMISDYTPIIPEGTEVTSNERAMLFDWLISVQQYFKVTTEVVHIATTLVDRFMWQNAVLWNEFQLLGMAAFFIGAKYISQRPKISLSRFVKLCESTYTVREVVNEESNLMSIFASVIDGPIPHWFLGYAFIGWYDIPTKIERYKLVMMCRYIFDQGLTEVALSRYSASLRCAGAIYLLRRLLRLSCQCSSKGALASCDFHTIKPWTKSLTKLTGHKESPGLKRVAYLYGLMLIEAQFLARDERKLNSMQGCASKYGAAFRKYAHSNSDSIALDPLMLSFTASDIADLDVL